jgi:hypothetical protein
MAESQARDQETTRAMHTNPDDADDECSSVTESVRKPLNAFDTEVEDYDLEDGFDNRGRRTRRSWWQTILMRARRKISLDDLKNGLDQALLQDSLSLNRRQRRKRTWYNYCIFGGISGLTIL